VIRRRTISIGLSGRSSVVVYGRRRVGSPLHSYWDHNAVTNNNNDPQELAAELIDRFRGQQSQWMSGRPKDWAEKTFEKGQAIAYNLPSHQVRDSNNNLVYQLDRAYEDDTRDTAAEQLAKAACGWLWSSTMPFNDADGERLAPLFERRL
jgi:hypothetical protein